MIDKKYTGIVTKADGEVIHDYIVFRAQDRAVPAMLDEYCKICTELGADNFHIEAIKKLRRRVIHYQQSTFSKIPDTKEEDLIFDATEGP